MVVDETHEWNEKQEMQKQYFDGFMVIWIMR